MPIVELVIRIVMLGLLWWVTTKWPPIASKIGAAKYAITALLVVVGLWWGCVAFGIHIPHLGNVPKIQ